jgi:cobalt-zinc-cadmium efflux system outer membrane protein
VRRRYHVLSWGILIALAAAVGTGTARGQGPTINPDTGSAPGGPGTLLGATPGAGAAASAGANAGAQYLGGRPGPTAPHTPTDITQPPPSTSALIAPSIAPPTGLEPAGLPIFGTLAVPKLAEEEGPPEGMTLDQAIERYVRENLDLRAQFMEIPQAEADILTASLRSNPVFYADGQLVPYGQYSNARPGGQTQYDVNISYPLDVTHKRRARTVSAQRAKRVLEAQYQDAVRQGIDNIYSAYVDVLQYRGAMKFAEVGVEGLRDVLKSTEALFRKGEQPKTAVNRVDLQLRLAESGLRSNRETYRRAKRALGVLLGMTSAQAEALEVRGSLKDTFPPPPTLEEMQRTALAIRPDIASFRLGVSRAEADVKLAKANVLQDIYVLYQPYTLQDNTWQGLKSPTSWALGVTVPIPVYNRNQGAIMRAKLNVTQTEIQLQALERTAMNDVRQAEQAYYTSLENLRRMESEILPDADRVLADSKRLFESGEITVIEYLNARRDYNDTARQYLDALVSHRRSMLDLNTALGQRMLP